MIRPLLVAFVLLIAIVALSAIHHSTKENKRYEIENGSPDEPYEAFMLQRTYPNKVFDAKTYRAALNDAAGRGQQLRSRNSPSWQLEGPGNIGGRFNCITINPLDSNVMYAGSANGGIWKTNDNCSTWFPVFDSVAYQAIGTIAINPNDTNEIWAGTGDLNISGTMYLGNGVYKSMDAGHTWSYVGLGNCYVVSSIIFNPANTNEVLIGTMGNSFSKDSNRGIYKTSNGGSSFTQMNYVNDSTGFIDMEQDPSSPSVVYATSFCRMRTERLSLSSGTEVYVYKSIDFGQTWNKLSGGLPNGQLHERLGIGICKSSPNTLYALYSTSNLTTPDLYVTNDGGMSWTQVSISFFDTYSYGGYGWYFGKIYVDPIDPNTIYIPGVYLQYSTNGGLTWNIRSQVPVHADGHFMDFISSGEFIYCTDGGLYKTNDGGMNWQDIENIPNNQFFSVTEDLINHGTYAGGVQDNGTLYGNASMMNNFIRIAGGDGFTVAYTHNPLLIYSETQNGNIIYADNFPNGFQTLSEDTTQNYNWSTPYFVSSFSDNIVFLAGQKVMRIDNAPYGNFVNISPVLNDSTSPKYVSNISTIGQSRIDSSILYAGTADGKVWNTLNGGVNWSDITPFLGNSYYVTKVMPSPNSITSAYVTRSGYRENDNTPLIFKTTNNGQTWTDITGDLPLLAVNDIEIFPGNEDVIFIANDAGVYESNNAGLNWERVGDNMPFVPVLDIQLNYDSKRIIAGTFGRSMYSIDVTSLVSGVEVMNDVSDITIYPNPSTDHIDIRSESKIEKINIYDATGRKILSTYSRRIDTSKMPSGNYFVQIIIGGKSVVKRLLKI